MSRMLLWAGIGLLAIGRGAVVDAGDEKPRHEAELKKLSGRWTTVREEKTADGTSRRSRIDLEFAGSTLKVFVYNDKGRLTFDGKLNVISAEELKGVGLGSVGRLGLAGAYEVKQKAEAHYDFVGEELVLVGRIGWRPWEGFHLSGQYRRAPAPK